MTRRTPRSTRADPLLPYTTLFRSRPRLAEPLFHALQHRFLRRDEVVRRLAEEDSARQRAVIAAVAAGDLEEGAFAGPELPVVPGEVRRRGVRSRQIGRAHV